ncbi:MAG: c-type cytochrome [Thiogranum sp.]
MSHEDKVFFSSFIGVLVVLVMIAFAFYFIADMVTSDMDTGGRLRQAKIDENIKPVGQVNVGTAPASGEAAETVAAGPRSGEQVYNASCLACHSTGIAGAPKVGDQATWAARAAKGIDGMLATAVSGLNAMPPKGTCADCSDEELKAAIVYMLSESGF